MNLTGNAGMATGGTGDLLTGMIAAWFAQLLDAEAACKLAVYLHGTAGDLAEADEGEVALVAGDIAARLGDAVMELTARRQVKRAVVRRRRFARRSGKTRLSPLVSASRAPSHRARSSSSTAISVPARPRSSAASRAASARPPTTCPVRRSRSFRSTPAAVTLYHVDLYRLEPAEVDDLGLDELVVRRRRSSRSSGPSAGATGRTMPSK